MKVGILTADSSLAVQLRQDLAQLGFSTIGEGDDQEAPAVILLDCRSSVPGLRDRYNIHDALVIAIIESRVDRPIDFLAGTAGVLFHPYSTEELSVRIELAVRSDSEDDLDTAFEWYGFRIDLIGYEVTVDGVKLDLTYKEFELLKCLVSSPGRVFTRSQLLKIVWGHDYVEGARTVDVHIRRLRSKLGTKYGSLIETVRHVGYRLTSDIASGRPRALSLQAKQPSAKQPDAR